MIIAALAISLSLTAQEPPPAGGMTYARTYSYFALASLELSRQAAGGGATSTPRAALERIRDSASAALPSVYALSDLDMDGVRAAERQARMDLTDSSDAEQAVILRDCATKLAVSPA